MLAGVGSVCWEVMADVSCFSILEIRHLKLRIPKMKRNGRNLYRRLYSSLESGAEPWREPVQWVPEVGDHLSVLQHGLLSWRCRARCGYLSLKACVTWALCPTFSWPVQRGSCSCVVTQASVLGVSSNLDRRVSFKVIRVQTQIGAVRC